MSDFVVSTPPGRVSILVSTFNRAPYLRESLDSLLAQTRKAHEIIVVNDGSSDGTDEILDEYADRIVVIRQQNSGKPRAINLAYERSSGEYLWIFDDDDVALPDSIALHAALLDQRKDLGFTYCGYLRGVDDDDKRIKVAEGVHVPSVDHDVFLIRLLETCFLTTQGMLIRRSAIAGHYLFNPELIRSQDYELFLRLASTSVGGWVEQASYIRRFHSGLRGSEKDRFEVARIEEKWFHYEKLASAAFLSEASLEYFLPRSLATRSTEPNLVYRALAQKAAILARKGLWGNLNSTIEALGQVRANQSDSIADENEVFERALRKDLAIREIITNSEVFERLKQALKVNLSQSEINAWARGLWFSLHESSCCLDRNERRIAICAVLRLLGVRGLLLETARKLRSLL